MGDREAFEKWIEKAQTCNAQIVDRGPVVLASEVRQYFQAAQDQDQAVNAAKWQISEAIFGYGLRKDDGYNLSMDDTDEMAEYIMRQLARAEYGTTDRSKWRVDDLVQDVNGDIFTIEGFKGDKLLIKDASENLWLTFADELTWHSRATQEEQ